MPWLSISSRCSRGYIALDCRAKSKNDWGRTCGVLAFTSTAAPWAWRLRLADIIRKTITPQPRPTDSPTRSDEHTSEVQSLMRTSYAAACVENKNDTRHEQE